MSEINKNFVEEMKWRGMVHDIMPGTEEQLLKEMTTAYVGFDPTAASLTVGNLVSVMILVHLQNAGHKPVALVGGATGMIGDPSGKSAERNLLSEEALLHNQNCVKKQLEKFLNFDCGANSAELVNNYDWFKGIGFIEFLRDVGKQLTVNYMMSKDSVKSRLETGISFTEFSYQLLQGYDFYHLYKNKNAKLQMGGSDQWGNITAGTELIRRMAGGEAFALTTPLLTKADGTKFGKSEGGNIWLDRNMTSPWKFYQFWINAADHDVMKYLKIFTTISKEEAEALEKEHFEAPERRLLQKRIAEEITTRVHSKEDVENIQKATEILFGKSSGMEDIENLDEEILNDALDVIEIPTSTYKETNTLIDLLSVNTDSKIFPSKGEARKMIQQGGVSINKAKITDPNHSIDFPLMKSKYLVIQKGKKNYYLLKTV